MENNYCMNNNVKITINEFLEAIIYGNIKKVKYFLDKGADPNDPLLGYNKYGMVSNYRPLTYAIEYSDKDALEFFEEETMSHLEIVKLLLEYGANPNYVEDRGGNIGAPAALAINECFEPNFTILKYLIEHGANPNLPGIVDTAAGCYNLQEGFYDRQTNSHSLFIRYDVIKYLADHGANVHGRENSSSLISAIMNGDLKLVKYLVENGSNVQYKDKQGRTLLSYNEQNDLEIENYLRQYIKEK